MNPPYRIHPQPPEEGLLFVNHEAKGRSGHLGHALVEVNAGEILAFFPNCSDVSDGHNGDGWMESCRSMDGVGSWLCPVPLDYSKSTYDSNPSRSVMCERALRCEDGSLLLFTLECGNTAEKKHYWMPLGIPRVLRSIDKGQSWGEPQDVGDEPGRIFDVIASEGEVLVLDLVNDNDADAFGHLPQHHYSLRVSSDGGHTFTKRSILPLELVAHLYGTLAILPGGAIAVYVYDKRDEFHLTTFISHDRGHSWEQARPVHFAKRIRNPKINGFRGGYILHGRSGSSGEGPEFGNLVLYWSTDGLNWDNGTIIETRLPDTAAFSGAYSNSVVVHDPSGIEPERLLIQASHGYRDALANIRHHWLL